MVAQLPEAVGLSQSVESTTTPLPYPDRFFAAALFAGFAPDTSSQEAKSVSSSFSDETSLLLYALYQQATVGQCNVAKPWSWNVVENAKWTSWNQLAKMSSTEAMWLFVRTLEEEDPLWWRKSQDAKTSLDVENPTPLALEEVISTSDEQLTSAAAQSGNDESTSVENIDINSNVSSNISTPSANGAASHNGHQNITDEVVPKKEHEEAYNQWSSPSILGRPPAARYEHAAAIVKDKMYVIGGNHNGRYLSDIQELDLHTFTWSKVDQKTSSSPSTKQSIASFHPCAGHSLIVWNGMLVTVAGHSKEPSDFVTVRGFDMATCTWSMLPSYGQAPVARGGQTVTKVGNCLIMFGGEDSRRCLYNDLNILDLETMTWDEIKAGGIPPSPRSDHTAAVRDNRYLFVFGGGSHSSCFNDLHILDLDNMEWSQPQQQGFRPSARAGHAAVTVGDNWYIIGGGDNKRGISDTIMLNMHTLVWHVIANENGKTPVASEGSSVVASIVHDDASLILFGGYNGQYSNEVRVCKTVPLKKTKLKTVHSTAASVASAVSQAAAAASPARDRPSTPALDGPSTPTRGGPVTVSANAESILSKSPSIQSPRFQLQGVEGNGTKNLTPIQAESAALSLEVEPSVIETLHQKLEEAQNEASKLKQEVAGILQENSDLDKELVAVRGQLAAEQSRCFRLEVDVAELKQKLQAMGSVKMELDQFRLQKAAADEAAVIAGQKPPQGVWNWLAGT